MAITIVRGMIQDCYELSIVDGGKIQDRYELSIVDGVNP